MHHRKVGIKPKFALILIILTAGLFLPFWLMSGKWVCMECGHKYKP